MSTRSRPARPGLARVQTTSRGGVDPRFPRRTSTPRGAASGRRTQPRYGLTGGVLQRRRPQKQSTMQRAFGGIASALPGVGGRTASKRSGRKRGAAGGIALVTAAAGLALKNRDKLPGRRSSSGSPTPVTTTPATTPAPVTPTAGTAPTPVTPAPPPTTPPSERPIGEQPGSTTPPAI